MKKEKGITLIALIITIIVMLILVGVTINVVINGGLFNTAKEAKRKTEKAALNEELTAMIATMNADIAANQEKYTITQDSDDNEAIEKLVQELETTIYKTLTTTGHDKITVTDETLVKNNGTEDTEDDYLYFLSSLVEGNEELLTNGVMTYEENDNGAICKIKVPCEYKENDIVIIVEALVGSETIEVTSFSLERSVTISMAQTTETVEVTAGESIKEVTEEGVPIPKGFYYVTGTKDTGVVISDSEADENNESGNNGNQFVWVPVGINPKLNITVSSLLSDITTVRIVNLGESYDETFEVNSNNFEKEIELTSNDLYEVIATSSDGTITNEFMCVKNVYKTITHKAAFLMEWIGEGSIEALMDLYFNQDDEDGAKEAEELLNQNGGSKVAALRYILVNTDGFNENEYSDVVAEQESVQKYGGFYIARYEAGTDGTNVTIKKGQTVTNNIAYADAKTAAEAMYTDSSYGVSSALPSGVAWDRTCEWFVETGRTYYKTWIKDRSSGNYGSSLKKSGSSESYKINNIYDLAGNVREWTTEIKIENSANVAHGFCYNVSGITSVGGSWNELTSTDNYTGYRPILYIK